MSRLEQLKRLIGHTAYSDAGTGKIIDVDEMDNQLIVAYSGGGCLSHPLHELTVINPAPVVREGRDPNRIPEVLHEVALYWQKHPDLRLGQLLSSFNVSYNTEDDVILERLRDPGYFDRPL